MLCLMAANVLQLPEGGDFEALQCQPSRNFDKCTNLDVTTEPPLLAKPSLHKITDFFTKNKKIFLGLD